METVSNNKEVDEMVASDNNIPTKRALLQERKKQLEKELAEYNQKLSELCTQEAELTGIIPPETPLEASDGLQFLNKHSAGVGDDNTLRRRHKTECQDHKIQANTLNQNFVEEKNVYEHIRQKKKQRLPSSEEDSNSITSNEHYSKQKYAHSLKSSLSLSPADTYPETKYPSPTYRQYRNSENMHYQYSRADDVLCSGIYRLSFNGYNDYLERNEKLGNLLHYSPPYNYMHNAYNQPVQMSHMSLQHSPHQTISRLSPHSSQSSHNQQYPQHSSLSQLPLSHYNSPGHSPNNTLISHHSSVFNRLPRRVVQRVTQPPAMQNIQPSRDGSPTKMNCSNTMGKNHYYNSHTMYRDTMQNLHKSPENNLYRVMSGDVGYKTYNLQPHQQYEHIGLGGCWKRSENGEMLWVHSSNTIDSNWQRDKRFGSLDRRRNKKPQRRISPNNKAATLGPMPNHKNQVKTAFIKISEVPNRKSDDHKQLVRTQSLGSVGQNIDCVYLSDDTSSFESDNKILADNRAVRRQKEREWFETSLDGPILPSLSHVVVPPRCQSVISSPLAPEDKYLYHRETPTPQIPPNPYPTVNLNVPQKVQYNVPQSLSPPPIRSCSSPKASLEIPAESNPSFRVVEPLDIEKLNNNIPMNCTIVQAGVCKPYYEETKPFEMSDFYKYSTKFKKSPQKQNYNETNRTLESTSGTTPLTNYTIPSSAEMPFNNQSNRESTLNTSLNLTNISVSQHFSDEMNAWYNDQDSESNASLPEDRSSATLV